MEAGQRPAGEMMKTVSPFGSWKSPITSDLIVQGSVSLFQPRIHGRDIFWIEMRPSEGGRYVVVRHASDGSVQDLVPSPFNSRTRVHEYGGGDYVVTNGQLYFSNFTDQRVYRAAIYSEKGNDSTPIAITPPEQLRYADYYPEDSRGRLICVREDHRAGSEQPVNALVALETGDENIGKVLASGYDFYSSPQVSPDGKYLAWLCWNHPNMPWDETELWVGEFSEDGSISKSRRVAGGNSESIFQPQWSPGRKLFFISDRSGWWNLYEYRQDGPYNLFPIAAEFGQPQWGFGMSTYGFVSPTRIICTYTEKGRSKLVLIDSETGNIEKIESPYSDIQYVRSSSETAVFRGGSGTKPAAIVRLDFATQKFETLRSSSTIKVDEGFISIPEAIEFPTEGGKTAHAIYYPPKNAEFEGPANEKPPLLVKIHGGPTAAASSTFSPVIQYWTSRGFAVLDVNYGGSTGYGTEYRRRLNGNWGVVDVDDCCNGALYLARQGLVDAGRLAITGGSAGGYTTLAALTFRNVFKAGASHYGVSDTEALVHDTHKFESRYLDGLIGPYPARKDLYEERSPVKHAENLHCPTIFFQGLEDKVVPPNQAEMMVAALREKGVPVAYVPFEGEQHGFRRAENIKRALDGEFYFYSRIFGFTPAESIEPVEIENL